jgi:hypothetical protein
MDPVRVLTKLEVQSTFFAHDPEWCEVGKGLVGLFNKRLLGNKSLDLGRCTSSLDLPVVMGGRKDRRTR